METVWFQHKVAMTRIFQLIEAPAVGDSVPEGTGTYSLWLLNLANRAQCPVMSSENNVQPLTGHQMVTFWWPPGFATTKELCSAPEGFFANIYKNHPLLAMHWQGCH